MNTRFPTTVAVLAAVTIFASGCTTLDPYTREMHGDWVTHPATLGYDDKATNEDRT